MQITATLSAAIDGAARRHGVAAAELRSALENESAPQLAVVLGIGVADAAAQLAQLERALTVQSDIGAGCVLLTDDLEAEVVAVLERL